MSKFVFRLVALFLIPCLLTDPLCAAAEFPRAVFPTLSASTRFSEDALMMRLLNIGKHPPLTVIQFKEAAQAEAPPEHDPEEWRGWEKVLVMTIVLIVSGGVILTKNFLWPADVLFRMTPAHWSSLLLWSGEVLLPAGIFGLVYNVWLAYQKWTMSNDDYEGGITSRVLVVLAMGLAMVYLPSVYYARDTPELRARLLAFESQAYVPPDHALDGARDLLSNILVFGLVNEFDRDDLAAALGVAVDPFMFLVPKKVLEEDTRWIPNALTHELWHLTPKEIAIEIADKVLMADLNKRIERTLNPEALKKETKKRGRTLSLDDYFALRWWTPAALKRDAEMRRDVKQLLHDSFIVETEAHQGGMAAIDAEHPRNETLVAYVTEQLKPIAASHRMSIPAWVSKVKSGDIDHTLPENYKFITYELARAYDPGGITDNFRRAIMRLHLQGGSYQSTLVTVLTRAVFDPSFNFDILTRTSAGARQYQSRFYAWFYSYVIQDPAEQSQLFPPFISHPRLLAEAA